MPDFNTSYVNIQLESLTIVGISSTISIHPMLIFNLAKENGIDKEDAFQYILC